jgi:hypothetical protein
MMFVRFPALKKTNPLEPVLPSWIMNIPGVFAELVNVKVEVVVSRMFPLLTPLPANTERPVVEDPAFTELVNVPVVPATAPLKVPATPETFPLNVPVVPETAPLKVPVVPETAPLNEPA